MSLHPAAYEEAKLAFKPLKRSRIAQKPSASLKTRPTHLKTQKRARKGRVKMPKTAKVQMIFNTMVKERGNWICVRCKKDYSNNKRLLQCSHFWGVGFTATRFDLDNCDPLCYPCHYGQLRTGWEYTKQSDYREYMLVKLGQERYDALEQKARSFKKLSEAKQEFLATLKEL